MKRERRFLNADVGVDTNGDSPKIAGYAAKFSVRSSNLGSFVEEIDPHAFDDCLANNPDIVGFWNHNDDIILGRTTSGTMRVSVDSIGLKYEIDPPSTQAARDLLVSLGRKDVTHSSFGFICHKDKWDVQPNGDLLRTILKAEVFDCSPVTFAAYPDATAGLRSFFPDDKGKMPEYLEAKVAELRAISETRTAETRAAQRKEKRYRNVLAAVSHTPWAILPEKLETICALLNARANGVSATKEEIQAVMGGSDTAQTTSLSSGVAVIPVLGPISQRMDLMTELCGGASCEGLSKSFNAALSDDSVSAIVFDIDSPGGTVTGVPEFAAEILAARGKKPIVAVANGMAASAAYWIASAADKFVVIPSGQVGSVGVYCTHEDLSKALEQEGVAISFIQAGKFKTDGNPYEPLSDSAREEMQKSVNDFYEMFVEAVGAGRGVSADVVKADFGQGRMFHAKDALAAGMVDDIATLEAVVAGLLKQDEATFTVTNVTADVVESAPVAVNEKADPADGDGPDMTSCQCMCAACQTGNCGDCSDPDCTDEFCNSAENIAQQMAPAPVAECITEDETEILRKRVRLAQADL